MPTVVDPALVTNHSVTLTGLNPATTYNFTLRSRSASGRIGTAAGSFTTPISGYVLTAVPGSFALTGIPVNLTYSQGRTIFASVGSFSLTGITANLTRAGAGPYTLTAAPGAFVLTGEPSVRDFGLQSDAGSFALTGIAANLVYTTGGGITVTSGGNWYVNVGFASSTATSPSLSSGTPAANRVILFGLVADYRDVSSVVFTPNAGSPVTVSTLDRAGLYASGLGATADCYIGHVSLPTGTTFTVTVNGTGTLDVVGFVYDLTNTASPAPVATYSSPRAYGATPMSMTIGAGQVGIAISVTDGVGAAWTGATVDEQAGTAGGFGIELARVTATGSVSQAGTSNLLLGGVWGP